MSLLYSSLLNDIAYHRALLQVVHIKYFEAEKATPARPFLIIY